MTPRGETVHFKRIKEEIMDLCPLEEIEQETVEVRRRNFRNIVECIDHIKSIIGVRKVQSCPVKVVSLVNYHVMSLTQ